MSHSIPEDLSPPLREILEAALRSGNAISGIDRDGWTNCPLAVSLRAPLVRAEIERAVRLPTSVHWWECHDAHYPLQAGYNCEATRHSISGPLPQRS